MSGIVPTIILDIGLGILAVSVMLCLYRIVKDRQLLTGR